jgi:hypothetical protein
VLRVNYFLAWRQRTDQRGMADQNQQHQNQPLRQEGLWNSHIWEYLTLEEVLTFSSCSHLTSSCPIQQSTAQLLINQHQHAKNIDPQFLDLNHMTLGILRKTIHRLVDGISTDSNPSYLTEFSGVIDESRAAADPFDEEPVAIEKHLESNSFDEFDDFNPRHPDYKSHRRGGSFFNSDLSDIAAQVYATDLSLIAKKALDFSETDDML